MLKAQVEPKAIMLSTDCCIGLPGEFQARCAQHRCENGRSSKCPIHQILAYIDKKSVAVCELSLIPSKAPIRQSTF